MLFARGAWAVFGLRKESLDAFASSLQDPAKLAEVAQSEAIKKSRESGVPTVGINPYGHPRIDESEEAALADEAFRVAEGVYAFWFVVNESEDVTHPKSKMEALAYRDASKPFKFLSKDEKAVIEASVEAQAVLARNQFPVILDFNAELAFAAEAKPETLGEVRHLIKNLGAEDYDLMWDFGTPDWPSLFLEAANERNKFHAQMKERAEELSRFRPEEVEKLDDKMVESIVSNYFAMSELDTGQWAGLSTPARICLGNSFDPVSASSPSTAFNVVENFEKTKIVAAAVTFQALDSRFSKKSDKEIQFRTDLFTIDVNDNVNNGDAGAAMLRGFDIPTFKRELKRAQKGVPDALPIGEYWFRWLVGMKDAVNTFTDNVIETLKGDKKQHGLRSYERPEEEGDE